MQAATAIISEVDLQVCYHADYGKNFIKKCKVSPDAYVQMVLQLAYFRVKKLSFSFAWILPIYKVPLLYVILHYYLTDFVM